jgi:phosphoglycolate phosphatase-like HAD superfamily hydrolase
MDRANDHFGTAFAPETVVVIGDTPRDVACGKVGGTKTVAVATGWYDVETLAAHDPDWVLDDLGDLGASLKALIG